MTQLLLQAPVSNSISLNTVVAGLVVIAALFLVALPKPTQTWYSFSSFAACVLRELLQQVYYAGKIWWQKIRTRRKSTANFARRWN